MRRPTRLRVRGLGFHGWYLTELVEAAARCGKRDAAGAALDRLGEVAEAAASDWALRVAARSRALLEEGEAAEELYREAVARLERTRMRVEPARAHLAYGEWLRRTNRRHDARDRLRGAHEMFAAFGAGGFAGRAARELREAGEKAVPRSDAASTYSPPRRRGSPSSPAGA
ncbi:hypothetical protein ACWDFL_15540 [Streptomyces bungoensis]